MVTRHDLTDVVVFRVFKQGGDVIALFPRIPGSVVDDSCQSYMHVGQHGAADYHGVVSVTRPATVRDASALKRELAQVGYVLAVRRRALYADHQARRGAA